MKISLDVVNENLLYEKLSNGLDVYILRKKDFNSYFATFITNFGGIDTEFIPINEKDYVKMPSGIAHFLEHKLFEQEEGDTVHDFYKKSGTYINAMTSYKKTKYIIKGTDNFIPNLNYLLDFVQSPYFTDENVEKEKGIILEEAYMCMDNKNKKFGETIMKNLYNEVYDNSVIGKVEDIKSITKEDLYRCYNSFYHPSNMALIVVSNMKEEDVLDTIKSNQEKKSFKKDFNIIKKEYKDTVKVKKEYELIKEDIKEDRLCYSIKLSLSSFNSTKIEVFDYLFILLDILVGSLSSFNLFLKENKIIKEDISFSIDSYYDYITVHIYSLTNKSNEFIKLLEEVLLDKKYSKELFDLYKRSVISDFNYKFNSVNGIEGYLISEYEFEGKIDSVNMNKEINLNYDDFVNIVDKFNIDNKSIVVMEGE